MPRDPQTLHWSKNTDVARSSCTSWKKKIQSRRYSTHTRTLQLRELLEYCSTALMEQRRQQTVRFIMTSTQLPCSGIPKILKWLNTDFIGQWIRSQHENGIASSVSGAPYVGFLLFLLNPAFDTYGRSLTKLVLQRLSGDYGYILCCSERHAHTILLTYGHRFPVCEFLETSKLIPFRVWFCRMCFCRELLWALLYLQNPFIVAFVVVVAQLHMFQIVHNILDFEHLCSTLELLGKKHVRRSQPAGALSSLFCKHRRFDSPPRKQHASNEQFL